MKAVKPLTACWIAFALFAGHLFAAEQTLVVNLSERSRADRVKGAVLYVNGYRRTISGQKLDYNSSHPAAHSALIVRAQKDQSMVWESDTLRAPDRDGFYHLIWLAGLACRGLDTLQPHHFDLLVNGKPLFHFANRKDFFGPRFSLEEMLSKLPGTRACVPRPSDLSAWEWLLRNDNGSMLHFKADKMDRYGDLFGTMGLTLPAKLVKRGAPLTLQIIGEDADSPDWCMTFEYRFHTEPEARVLPVELRQSPYNRLVSFSVDDLGVMGVLAVAVGESYPMTQSLTLGANTLDVGVPDSPGSDFTVIYQHNGVETRREKLTLPPVTPRDFYLLPYSHTDIGYTDLQTVVLQKHCHYIDDALRLIEKTKDYPENARFKWNIEVLWPLETYLEKADSTHKQAFVQAVKNGSIGVNAFYANVLTGLMGAEELNHCFDYAHTFSSQNRIPVNTAVISDIPGFVWGTVNALAHNGVRYFASATNPYDRIGHMLEVWGDKPFWWKSQSGTDSVLMWMPAASYATFHKGSLSQLGENKIFELMQNLDDEKYPYRIVQLPYTIGDNAGTDSTLSDFVKQWNEKYASPHLIIATHEQMFEAFEKDYGRQLPSFAGDLTPYWEDGAMSTANETIRNRWSSSRLSQLETLSQAKRLDSALVRTWENVILFDEHTWGAANSVDEPDNLMVKAQWKVKQQFSRDAEYNAARLQIRAFPEPAIIQSADWAYEAYNTSSSRRTDLIVLTSPEFSDRDGIVDASGKRIPSQRLNVYQRAVRVRDVPAHGMKYIRVQSGKDDPRGDTRVEDLTLSNSDLSVTVDRQTGVVTRLYSKLLGKDFADRTAGLDRLLYIAGTDPSSAQPLSNVRVEVVDSGGLVATVRVDGETVAGDTNTCWIRLIDGINRVDITHRIHKRPIRTKEAVHIAFPFNVPDGQIRYDVASAIVRPELDQLPGSNKNFFSVNSWIDVSNKDYGITLATPDIPLAEFGEITAEQPWREHVAPGNTVYSYVLNNYWHTNFKADQSGEIEFHYSLQPHGPFDPVQANAFGQEQREPLMVVPAPQQPKPKAK